MQQTFTKICSALGVEPDAALSKSRKGEYVEARQIFCLLLHNPKDPDCTKNKLGKFLRRDRTTIIHLLNRVNDLYLTEQSFRDKVNKIKEVL